MWLIMSDGGKNDSGCYGSYKYWRGICLDRKMRLQKSGVVSSRDMYIRNISTSNEAEYMALISALLSMHKRLYDGEAKDGRCFVHSDSLLLVNQLNGAWRVKADNLKPLYEEAMALLSKFNGFVAQHIPRTLIEAHLGH